MMDDTDLTDPHGEAEALRRENARLRAERDRFEAALARACLVGGTTYLIERAEAAEAALAAAPVAEAQPVAWRVYGMMRQRVPSYVKAQGRGSDPTEYLYQADRGIDAAECARLMRGEVQPLYAHPPAQPTIGGAELDALRIWKLANMRDADDPEYVSAITALRAQPDWKAMAERLGEALGDALIVLEEADTAGSQVAADARAAMSYLAKMKGE